MTDTADLTRIITRATRARVSSDDTERIAAAFLAAGYRKPAPTDPKPSAREVAAAAKTGGVGMIVQAVHTIRADQLDEHGEDAILAWIKQALRELAAGGANPYLDATVQLVGMNDGTLVVTAEGLIGGGR
jgi:hypothetical protein